MIRTAERIIDDGTSAHRDDEHLGDDHHHPPRAQDGGQPDGAQAQRGVAKNHGINDIDTSRTTTALYDREADSEDWRTVTLVHTPDSTDMMTEEEMLDPDNAERLRAIPDGGSIALRTPRVGFFSSPAFFQTWLTNRDNTSA